MAVCGTLPAVRVPLSIALALLLAVPLGLWFAFTRGMDFLTPPSAETLEVVRQRALTMLPRSEVQLPSSPATSRDIDRNPPRPIQTRPPAPDAVAERNPSLDTFANLAVKGSRHLVELSTLLEASGDRQRTLLLWERVIDSTKPDATHLAAAMAVVKRLRRVVPLWSAGHSPVPIVIRVSANAPLEEKLKPLMDQLAKELATASHGVLAPTTELVIVPAKPVGKRSSSRRSSAPAVSLQLSGAREDSQATATVSFTATKSETLHADLLRTLFKLAATRLAADKAYPQITTPPKTEAPIDSLSFRITRLRWLKLGEALNVPKPPPDP